MQCFQLQKISSSYIHVHPCQADLCPSHIHLCQKSFTHRVNTLKWGILSCACARRKNANPCCSSSNELSASLTDLLSKLKPPHCFSDIVTKSHHILFLLAFYKKDQCEGMALTLPPVSLQAVAWLPSWRKTVISLNGSNTGVLHNCSKKNNLERNPHQHAKHRVVHL